ncbi:MAG: hypothetical protein K0U84_24760 [Actinomycetia bacterium]|nr:hypothetical protein [Actinomycetes bacterium]
MLAQLHRFEIDTEIRSTAAAYADPALHSLDAIHLSSAQMVSKNKPLTALVAYDTPSSWPLKP